MYIKTDIEFNIVSCIQVGLPPTREDNWFQVENIPDDILKNLFSYRYINGEFVLKENGNELKLQKIRNVKISSMSEICHNTIINGFDHVDGHHYSLNNSDQMSLSTLSIRASQGLDTTWHFDGGDCQIYSPQEMLKLTEYAFKFITYHQTYFNQLRSQINNTNSIDEIINTKYGTPLTGIYAENLEKITGGFVPTITLIEDYINYSDVMCDVKRVSVPPDEDIDNNIEEDVVPQENVGDDV